VGNVNRNLRVTLSTDVFLKFSVRFFCFRYHFEWRNFCLHLYKLHLYKLHFSYDILLYSVQNTRTQI